MEVKKSNWRKFLDIFSSTDKVLVTGGLGYVGSHVVIALMEAGYEVLVIDNLASSSIEVLYAIESITGKKPSFENIDCTDFVAMDHFFGRNEDISCVVNCASLKAVGDSRRNPTLYYRNNLMAMVNLVELVPIHKISGIVHSSSCTVYGQITKNPIDEKHVMKKALSPFSNTQQIAEEILADAMNANENLHGIVLRYFNAVGAHHSGLLGEYPHGAPSNLVPLLTQVAAGKRESIKIFGNDHNTPDGTIVRDYLDINDLAAAYVLAVERICKKKTKGLEAYNLGIGYGLSVLDLIARFEEANGIAINYTIEPKRAGELEQAWVNPTKAMKTLKWEPTTPIEETLRNAWKWQQKLG